MDGDVGVTPAVPSRRQTVRFWLTVSLYDGGVMLLIMACALPVYGPDAAAQLYLQHIAWCLGIFSIVCLLFVSLIRLPYRPPKRWLLPAWRVLAEVELAVTTAAFVLLVIQPSSAGQLTEIFLQVAIVGVWICFASGLVLGIQGRTNRMLSHARAQSGTATPDSAVSPDGETGS